MKMLVEKSSLGLRLFFVQFFTIFACAFFKFKNLTWWDGEWYAHIVRNGYSATLSADPTVPNLGNVGFFPGYPIAGWLVQKVLSLGGDSFPPEFALLIVSYLFAILCFYYIRKWLELHQDARTAQKLILFALYPFTMFFYVAYSEAIYTAFAIGFFYFAEKFILAMRQNGATERTAKNRSWLYYALAMLHGFLMNGTRLLGIVFVIYPFLRSLQVGRARIASACLWFFTYVSVACFFLYCQIKFGAWNFYFITEDKIWGTKVDWSKLLPPTELFNFFRPLRADTTGKYITLLLGGYLTYHLYKLVIRRDWKNPFLALVLVCGMFWGEHILGRAAWKFAGMGRMMIPVIILILPSLNIQPKRNWKWAFIVILFLSLQIAYALKFARYGWVA